MSIAVLFAAIEIISTARVYSVNEGTECVWDSVFETDKYIKCQNATVHINVHYSKTDVSEISITAKQAFSVFQVFILLFLGFAGVAVILDALIY